MDHGWMFVAKGLHARLFDIGVNGDIRPNAIESITWVGTDRFELGLSETVTWTDSAPIQASEVVGALERGQIVLGQRFLNVEKLRQKSIVVRSSLDIGLLKILLASVLFKEVSNVRAVPLICDFY
jgi:hypothetical protein